MWNVSPSTWSFLRLLHFHSTVFKNIRTNINIKIYCIPSKNETKLFNWSILFFQTPDFVRVPLVLSTSVWKLSCWIITFLRYLLLPGYNKIWNTCWCNQLGLSKIQEVGQHWHPLKKNFHLRQYHSNVLPPVSMRPLLVA